MKQGLQDKDNPLMTSNNNANNNAGSPNSMTSPMMASMQSSTGSVTSIDSVGVNNTNGVSESNGNGQQWSPRSAEEHSPQSGQVPPVVSASGTPPSHALTSPPVGNYEMMTTGHHPPISVMKHEMSPPLPTNGSSTPSAMVPYSVNGMHMPGMIPQDNLYMSGVPLHQGSLPTTPITAQPPHQAMMSSSFWYAGAEDGSVPAHPVAHAVPQPPMRSPTYLK